MAIIYRPRGTALRLWSEAAFTPMKDGQ